MTIPMSFNPVGRTSSPMAPPVRREGQAAAPATGAVGAPGMARDAFVRGAAPFRDVAVTQSIARLDDRRGKLADDLKALSMREAAGLPAPSGSSYGKLRADIGRTDELLSSLRADAAKVAATRDADGQAVDNFKALMVKAEQVPLSADQALKIKIQAHDIARNLGRDFPSDPTITATQLQLADRIGQIADERTALLHAAKTRSLTGDALAAAPGKVAALDRQESLIRAMIAHGDRVADRPTPASGRDVDTLKALMTKASGAGLTAADTLKLLDEVEQLGR